MKNNKNEIIHTDPFIPSDKIYQPPICFIWQIGDFWLIIGPIPCREEERTSNIRNLPSLQPAKTTLGF